MVCQDIFRSPLCWKKRGHHMASGRHHPGWQRLSFTPSSCIAEPLPPDGRGVGGKAVSVRARSRDGIRRRAESIDRSAEDIRYSPLASWLPLRVCGGLTCRYSFRVPRYHTIHNVYLTCTTLAGEAQLASRSVALLPQTATSPPDLGYFFRRRCLGPHQSGNLQRGSPSFGALYAAIAFSD